MCQILPHAQVLGKPYLKTKTFQYCFFLLQLPQCLLMATSNYEVTLILSVNSAHNIWINTFAARLIQAVRVKSTCSHVALHRHHSGTECAGELFKPSKGSASLRVFIKNKFLVLFFFVSNVKTGVLLGLFGPLHLALGLKC